jgi:hypothetical protein
VKNISKNPRALPELAKQRRHLILRGGSPVGFKYKTKNPNLFRLGFHKKRRRTNPPRRGTRRTNKNKTRDLQVELAKQSLSFATPVRIARVRQAFHKKRRRHEPCDCAAPIKKPPAFSSWGFNKERRRTDPPRRGTRRTNKKQESLSFATPVRFARVRQAFHKKRRRTDPPRRGTRRTNKKQKTPSFFKLGVQ